MNRRSRMMLFVAGVAAFLQAVATLGSFAWLSRNLPVPEVGRFGLYLAIVSLALALDGLRQVAVVTAASQSGQQEDQLAYLAAISVCFGVLVAVGVVIVGRLLLTLAWIEVVPLASTCFLLLATSPGLARLEASGGPHIAVALHSISWSVALALGSSLAAYAGSAPIAAWAMLTAPLIVLSALASRRLLVRPSLRSDEQITRFAVQGIGSHFVTAISSFLDKGAVAVQAGPYALGLYTPLSEVAGRASALSGLVANLFLNDEIRSSVPNSGDFRSRVSHGRFMDVFFAIAACGIVSAAIFARHGLDLFVARSSPPEVLAFRILLACLALNIGAQWSAVTLRARGRFDLYRPYAASLVAALALAPWLVSNAGIIGAALLVLIMRTADIALIFRARQMLSSIQWAAIAAAAIIVLTVAFADAVASGTWT